MSAKFTDKTICLHFMSAFADALCRHKMQTLHTEIYCLNIQQPTSSFAYGNNKI